MPRTLYTAGLLTIFLVGGTVLLRAQAPIGEVFAADSSLSGSVLYAGSGTPVMNGSQVAAGGRSAILKLTRGGEIRICPSTSLTVGASPNGRNLLFSLNDGSVEFHFDITNESDAVQTPDFRIQFAGPGRFDLAMCTDKQGGLSLRGNNSSRAAVVVSEMLGDGVYQVPAGRSIDFHAGTVQDPTAGQRRCGCPEQEIPAAVNNVLTAQAPPPAAPAPEKMDEPTTSGTPSTPPPPPNATQTVETHVQVDAPFVYHGDELRPEAEYTLAKMQTVSAMEVGTKLIPTITPPAAKSAAAQRGVHPEKKGGFFRKLGSFFGRMFKG